MHFVITPEGLVRSVHSDEAQQILSAVGSVSLRRASHVEPYACLSEAAKQQLRDQNSAVDTPNAWFADLSPVKGPILGPFSKREEALSAEYKWLIDNDIPEASTSPAV